MVKGHAFLLDHFKLIIIQLSNFYPPSFIWNSNITNHEGGMLLWPILVYKGNCFSMLIVFINKINVSLCSSLSYIYRKNRKYGIRHSDICKYFTLSVSLLHRLLHSYVSISFILFYTPVSLSFSCFPSPLFSFNSIVFFIGFRSRRFLDGSRLPKHKI